MQNVEEQYEAASFLERDWSIVSRDRISDVATDAQPGNAAIGSIHDIWKHTVEKSQTHGNVAIGSIQDIWKHKVEKIETHGMLLFASSNNHRL